MKIIQILPEFNEGGVERGALEVSRELVKRGHESWIISKGTKLIPQLEAEGGKHYTLDVCSKNPFSAPARVLALKKAFLEIQPDVIHARSRVPAWLTRFANKKLKIPFVTTVHGLNSINRYSRIMVSGDSVIAVGDPIRDYVCNAYDVDPAEITVVPRGVDMQLFSPDNIDPSFVASFKKEFGLEEAFIVTSVGRITKIKDYETFIDAIAQLAPKYPQIRGVIVGGAREDKLDYFNSLKERAAEKNVADKIIFAGSQSKMPEIYHLSDVMVNATLTMGNVGRTVAEALALNTPVLATSMPKLKNIVVDGVNGYVIEVNNTESLAHSIEKILLNPILETRSSIPYEHTLDSLIDSLITIYEKTIRRQ